MCLRPENLDNVCLEHFGLFLARNGSKGIELASLKLIAPGGDLVSEISKMDLWCPNATFADLTNAVHRLDRTVKAALHPSIVSAVEVREGYWQLYEMYVIHFA